MTTFKLIALCFMFLSSQVAATEYRLVVPTVSEHIGDYKGYTVVDGVTTIGEITGIQDSFLSNIPIPELHEEDLNNQNYGLGLEIKSDGFIYTLVALKNSFNETSIYLGFSKEERLTANLYYSYGITVANGYEILTDSGYMTAPNMTLRYKNIRLSTTYPFANLLCPVEECADVINLQYVMPF